MAGKPVTKEEALQYESSALTADTEKRKNNIKTIESAISREKADIEYDERIIASIDPKHPDVDKLKELIDKKKLNIKAFEDAIRDEHEQIDRDLQMVKLIEEN